MTGGEISGNEVVGTSQVTQGSTGTFTNDGGTVTENVLPTHTHTCTHTHTVADGEWIAFSSVWKGDAVRTPIPGGRYYLDEDITLNSGADATKTSGDINFTGDSVFCLNGHTLNGGNVANMFRTEGTVTVDICDCAGTGTVTGHKNAGTTQSVIIARNGGTVNICGGTFTGNSGKSLMYIADGTHVAVNILGGTFEGNTTETDVYFAQDGSTTGTAEMTLYGSETFTASTEKHLWYYFNPTDVAGQYTLKTSRYCAHTELTHVPAAGKTCEQDGNIEYWSCSCGKYFSDADAKTEITLADTVIKAGHEYGQLVEAQDPIHTIDTLKAGVAAHYFCDVCDTYFTEEKVEVEYEELIGETPAHAYTNVNGYKAEEGHADTCACGAVGEVTGHTPNVEAATEETAKFCTVCEYVMEAQLSHVHANNLTHVPAVANDCDKDGNIEYWSCSCGKYFSDAAAVSEITDKTTVVIPAAHDIINHDGQAAAPGIAGWNAYQTCSRCDYSTYTEIPALEIGADQTVKVETFKEAGKTPVSEEGFFAGYYADADHSIAYTTDSGDAYVKFVARDVLSVKGQLAVGTTAQSEKTDLRLLTTVDDLNYRQIGFKITVGGRTVTVSTNKVFERIVANEGGVAYDKTPSVFHEQSGYFMTYTITDIPADVFGTTITVVPYWVTLDGTEQEGRALTFTIAEVINGEF
ncbi:MAG: hypothetical protein IJP02_07370, partial [Oscillospiraceae bacterium]|nr:hypothetical protein [Oscillospiraceae bacterium]